MKGEPFHGMKPYSHPKPEEDPKLQNIVNNEHISTWDEIPGELAEAYRQMVAESPADERREGVESDMLKKFKEALVELSPRESFVLRMRTGVLSDKPMSVDDLKEIFSDDEYRRNSIEMLASLTPEQAKQVRQDDLFSQMILTALCIFPEEKHTYSWSELGAVFGKNEDAMKMKYYRNLPKIKARLQRLRKFIDGKEESL